MKEEQQKGKKHTFKILSKKYNKTNRSNAYTYIKFDFERNLKHYRNKSYPMSDYIKTEEDVFKLHEATDKVTKNRQPQTVEFSNGKVINFFKSCI